MWAKKFGVALIVLSSFGGALAQDKTEVEFVTKFFDALQPKSIAQNREYCGFFGIDDNENYIATTPTEGEEGSCLAADPPPDMLIFASYHTHGGFSYDYDSETPSSNDLEADIAEELDGYIATPGGRIWFDSIEHQKAELVCGRNCTVSDPKYDVDGVKAVNNSYSLDQLLARESE